MKNMFPTTTMQTAPAGAPLEENAPDAITRAPRRCAQLGASSRRHRGHSASHERRAFGFRSREPASFGPSRRGEGVGGLGAVGGGSPTFFLARESESRYPTWISESVSNVGILAPGYPTKRGPLVIPFLGTWVIKSVPPTLPWNP